jgi:phosphomevalonate kinase
VKAVQAAAPGKLLLIGEYAVLDGAPALVMAVDRRVNVRIESASGGAGWLSAAQLGIRQAAMRIKDGQLQCDGMDRGALGLTGRLIPAIMRALGRAPEEVAALDIEIDSGALFESHAGRPVKLGLGSSAAVCAALAVGLSEWFEDPADSAQAGDRLGRWLPVYREALRARASGADLAAAFFGGFSRFRSSGDAVDCRTLDWPEELYWRAVWTRQAAQTTDFVGAFDAWKRNDPAGAAAILSRLNEIALRASENAGDATGLLEACRAYATAMEALEAAMSVEIMTAPHRRLAEFGRQCGVVYKSCGAGGGDLGVALAPDPGRLRAFETGVSDRGGVPLNLAISNSGAGPAPRRVPETGEENQ